MRGLVGKPVIGVAFDRDVVFLHPFDELKRAAADDLGGIGRRGAGGGSPIGEQDIRPDVLRDDGECADLIDEGRAGAGRHDFDGLVIDDGVGLQGSHDVGPVRAQTIFGEHGIEGVDDILGGDGLAIVPGGIGVDVEAGARAVGVDLPRIGQARDQFALDHGDPDEALEDETGDPAGGDVGAEDWIQRLDIAGMNLDEVPTGLAMEG
ncbi:MAG: hypothetical protein QM589_14695 [Thermomicrobiales bacterium]